MKQDVVLNDDKLPQWLYESDTILDINCGIGDSLIYLLHNFTTIRGICVVGTNKIKYKYARLNVQMHGLSDRIEVINKDMYDPVVLSKYNFSDVVYMDFHHNADEEYLQYFANELMNNALIRASKPGRILISYGKLLFDSAQFQASYTLHFASGYHPELVEDVSVYMYSIPFYLSKLSSLGIDGNYAIFYGYQPIFSGLDLESPIETDDLLSFLTSSANRLNESDQMEEATEVTEQNEQQNLELRECESSEQTKNSDSFHESVDAPSNNLSDEDAIFEIITSGVSMGEFDEIGEIQKIWTMISSSLLYQSFLNCLQNMIRSDFESDNSKVIHYEVLWMI